MWKTHFSYNSVGKLADYFEKYDVKSDKILIKNISEDPDFEENSGVNFPGFQFEILLEKTWKEVEKTTNNIHPNLDLIALEVATQDGQFIFRFNKNPGIIGKCEGCYASGVMKVICGCKKVAYCNEHCR